MLLPPLVLVLVQVLSCCRAEQHIYGKYFSRQKDGNKSYFANTYWLYKPTSPVAGSALSPVIFQIFGSGWVHGGGPFHYLTPAIMEYQKNGITYVSTSYRLVDAHYHFEDAAGNVQPEELIHIGKDGELTLDTTGRKYSEVETMDVHAESKIMKCAFDVVQSLEHLIRNSISHGVDVHRIVFFASSAGAAQANYLLYRYHKWNVDRFTPVGVVMGSPQFNLPVFGIQDTSWKGIRQHTKPGTTVNDVFDFGACYACILHTGSVCSSSNKFNETTIQTLENTQVWNRSIPEFGTRLLKLWMTGEMMLEHVPKPFHMFVHNNQAELSCIHHPIYAQQYAEIADKIGINFTVYYQTYKNALQNFRKPYFKTAVEEHLLVPASTPPDVGNFTLEVYNISDPLEIYYASSTAWYDKFEAVRSLYPKMPDPLRIHEHMLFVCYLLGLQSCGPSKAQATVLRTHVPVMSWDPARNKTAHPSDVSGRRRYSDDQYSWARKARTALLALVSHTSVLSAACVFLVILALLVPVVRRLHSAFRPVGRRETKAIAEDEGVFPASSDFGLE